MPPPADGMVGRRIAVAGQTMFFRCSRRPAAGWPAVVLVHGLGLSGRYMLPIARQLAPHEAIAPSRLDRVSDEDIARFVVSHIPNAGIRRAWSARPTAR